MKIKIANKKLEFLNLTQGIYLCDQMVTFDLWTVFMPSDSIAKFNTDRGMNYPIYGISFQEILAYIDILNKESILDDNYYFDIPNVSERNSLLEKIKAVNQEEGSLDKYAWYGLNSLNSVHKGAQKRPLLGFYDLIGNVLEWCYSSGNRFSYDEDYIQPALGGSYDSPIDECFSISYISNKNEFNEVVGFRIGIFEKGLKR